MSTRVRTVRARALRWSVAALLCATTVAVDAGPFSDGHTASATGPAFQMFDNGKMRFGGNPADNCYSGCATVATPESSLSALGLLKQPFYYSSASSKWFKLTFSTYPLNLAIGSGTGGGNWSGAHVTDITSLAGMTIDTTGFVSTGAAGSGEKGYGALEATGTATINGQLFRITNRSELGATDSYVKITTTITNISGSPSTHTTMWVGTQDDFVGSNDSPTKTKGNIVDGVFAATGADATPASALLIESGPEGVLFYSTTPGANASIDSCCNFANAYNVAPTSSPRVLTGDGSYAMNLPVADLADGASTQIVWFYAAGATADLATVISQVGAAAQPTAPTVAPGNHQASVSWTAPASTDPITDYIVRYRANGSNGAWTEVRKGDATAPLSLDVTGLTNGTQYEIQLAAVTGTSPSEVIGSYSASALVSPGNPVNTVLPTISGSATVGATLTAVDPNGNWTSIDGTSMTASYQWQAEGVDIPGATSSTFVVTPSQIGSHIRLVVTRTNTAGATHVTTAATTAVPTVNAPGTTGATTLSPGNHQATVAWNTPTFTDPVSNYRIRYRPTGSGTWTTVDTGSLSAPLHTDITGLTNGTQYDVQVAAASGVSPYYVVGSFSPTATVTPGNPVNSSPPVVLGNATVGATLTAVDPNSNWTSIDGTSMTASYQWQAEGVDIPGATSSTFVVTPSQIGSHIRVVATRTNTAGATSATSAATAAVPTVNAPGQPGAATVTPGNGTATVTWTAGTSTDPITNHRIRYRPVGSGTWTTVDTGSLSAPLSFELTGLTNGTQYEIQVAAASGVAPYYVVGPYAPIVTVFPGNPVNTGLPTISGDLKVASTLTVVDPDGNWTSVDGTPLVATYQWQADGIDIPGATSSTFVVSPAQAGAHLRVVVTRTNGSGAASATSAATTTVPAVYLSGLGSSDLTVTPAFDPTHTSYTASVESGVASVTMDPAAPAGTTVTYTVNGVSVAAGPPAVLPLDYGDNTVVVTISRDGVSVSYTIVVNRQSPMPSFHTTTPTRLLDTRSTPSPTGRGQLQKVTVAGVAGVPIDAASAVLNITVAGAEGSGFVTVYPCGEKRPWASNLNYSAGQTISNTVVAKIGTEGQVCIYSTAGAEVVVDVSGFFRIGVGDKYLPITPARLVDTRESGELVGDGQVLEVTVAGRAGLPADSTAAALNVTITEPTGAGFVTVYPCGTERPLASNLNYVAGQTVSNAAVAQIGTDGKVCVYVQTATHVVVDVNGAYTPTGPALQQSFSPFRLMDTREGGIPVGSGQVLEVTVAGAGEVPSNALAAVLNLTVVDPTGNGFATVYPCGTARPWASNLNYVANVTVPNAVIAKIGVDGKVCVFLQTEAHVVIDVNGSMTAV